MSERVLVTGGTGFIASHVVQELLDHGYLVRATVRTTTAVLPDQVETVQTDLDSDDGWAEAVAECDYVMHIASPVPPTIPDDEQELIRPTVDGTMRVLRAAAASDGVKRVVLTSSTAAIGSGYDRRDHTVRTELDWSILDTSTAYQKSKTLAERAAWDFVADLPAAQRFDLVALHPAWVLGPLRRSSVPSSLEYVRRLLARQLPGSPRMTNPVVDVRDVAVAYRLAIEIPQAAGNRYILAGEELWKREVAAILAAEFNDRGFRVPTGTIPNWVIRLMAPFNQSARMMLYFLDRREILSSAKAQRELGWATRPARDSIIDTATSLIEWGIVAPRGSGPVPKG